LPAGALDFVEHDDVGPETGVDVEAVADDLLVVDDGKKWRLSLGIVFRAERAGAENDALVERGELVDLLLPHRLERGGGDDEDALGFSQMVEQGAGGDGLDGLAKARSARRRPSASKSGRRVGASFPRRGILPCSDA
jgi:hypothetical protein